MASVKGKLGFGRVVRTRRTGVGPIGLTLTARDSARLTPEAPFS